MPQNLVFAPLWTYSTEKNSHPARLHFGGSPDNEIRMPTCFDLIEGVVDVKSRFVAMFAIAAALMVSAPLAYAQGPNSDSSSRGTTGLFTVPVAALMGEGEFSFAASYASTSQQPGDSSIESSGISGAMGFNVGKGLEVYGLFEPRMGVHRNYTVASDPVAPRLDDHPLAVNRWGLGIGDIFNARVAGNFVNTDIAGSLEYSCKVAGAKVIVVLGHTHCGAIKSVCAGVKMGNITSIGRSRAKTYRTERPGTTFDDVAGYEGVKTEITEIVSGAEAL